MISIVLASMTCLAVANTNAGDAECLQSEKEREQGDFFLLQKHMSLQTDAEDDLPVLTLLGRSFYSKDPQLSAHWMHRYLNAKLVDNPSDMIVMPGAVTAGSFLKSNTEAGDYTVLFAQGAEPDDGMDAFADSAEHVFNYWTSPSQQNWSHWGDLHDGIADYTFNLSNAADDGLKFFHHFHTVTRTYLDGTTLTFEMKLAGATNDSNATGFGFVIEPEDEQYLTEHCWDLDEPCRASTEEESSHIAEDGVNLHLWWKSTFSVVNASNARAFAKDVLGATDSYCPFPYPPSEHCTGALWMKVAQEGDTFFQLHFVEFWKGHEHSEIFKYHEYHAAQAKALSQGCMMPAMYNNVAFNVATLDPFVDRLRKTSTSFLAMKTSGGRYALLFAFPGNEAIVVQLQSDVLTKADAVDAQSVAEACAHTQQTLS